MGRISDAIDRADKPIYTTQSGLQPNAGKRALAGYVVGSALVAAVVIGASLIGNSTAWFIISSLVVLAGLVAYVVWRRRRNRALTGSPTTWPSQD